MLSMLSASSSSTSSHIPIPSNGLISYPPQDPGALLGWGGFGRTKSAVIPMLDQLEQDGWNIFRYYSVPAWAQPEWGTADINYDILGHLIEESQKRGIYVMLNIAHNFPTGAFIDEHQQEWIDGYLNDLANIEFTTPGLTAKTCDNIIFDLANEYTGSQSNIISHYNALILALRNEGYTQPCCLSYWWNHDIAHCVSQVDDPLNNFMAGMHHYAQSNNFDDYDTPGTFTEVCQNSGIEDYWQNLWNARVQPVLDLGVPYCAGELGTGWDYKYTRGGVAFCMKFFQMAKADGNVHVIMHRWNFGGSSYEIDYQNYYDAAQQYWGEDFF